MAMPRPSGKALRIAEKVVPGLSRLKKRRSRKNSGVRGSLSEVEIKQTKGIQDEAY